MTKVAITIPDDQMRTLERIRRQSRLPRSRVIQQALRFYFDHVGLSSEISAYEKAYARKPERAGEARAYAAAAAEVLDAEDWE